MASQAAVADMSLDDIRMNSMDLLDKEEIDSGGFAKVYLCCHRTHGLVAIKTVFTGEKSKSYNNDLYEEGKRMYKLNHERIVKLLGIILEDGNYALVMEYMTKGNLLHVLKQVTVPVSVKARFILEIIEGMRYLHKQNLIHKDLKPENILVNDEFHAKIADLGVAAFQKWSTLTKEETARQGPQSRNKSTAKTKNAGTLSYMAPEHLQSLNVKASEKSDIYSFAVVIWVILTNKEPYENAINSDQVSHCVTSGDRPDVQESLQCGLKEASDLMEQCWTVKPEDRPSFKDCEKTFRPIYCEKYEKDVEKDVAAVKESYPKPEAFIQRMASLQLDCDAEPPSIPRDEPLSLHSSLGFQHGHVNESLFSPYSNEPVECEEENCDNFLERKLQEEMNYHQTGSRIDHMTNLSNPVPMSDHQTGSRIDHMTNLSNPVPMSDHQTGSRIDHMTNLSNPVPMSDLRSKKVFSEPNPRNSTPVGSYPVNPPYGSKHEPLAHVSPPYTYNAVPQSASGFPTPSRSVSYHKPDELRSMYNPAFPNVMWDPYLPTPPTFPNMYIPDNSVPFDSTKLPVAESSRPNVYSLPLNPTYNASTGYAVGMEGNSMFPKGNFGYSPGYYPEKSVNLTISNSTAFQIGNNNYLGVGRESNMKSNPVSQASNYIPHEYAEVLGSKSLLNDEQIKLLRDNLSRKWKEFARIVGFRPPEIEEIDHDYDRDGLKEKVYQMLRKWQMREGSKNTTVGKVATALYCLKDTDLLSQLIRLN